MPEFALQFYVIIPQRLKNGFAKITKLSFPIRGFAIPYSHGRTSHAIFSTCRIADTGRDTHYPGQLMPYI
jgi:hypothetical protein